MKDRSGHGRSRRRIFNELETVLSRRWCVEQILLGRFSGARHALHHFSLSGRIYKELMFSGSACFESCLEIRSGVPCPGSGCLTKS